MSYARLGSFDVLSLRLVFELAGPGRADVELGIGDDAAPAVGTALVLTLGSRSFAGTVIRSTADNGRARVSWEQGGGRWSTTLSARTYRDVLVRTIAEHVVADAGETISAATLAALPDVVLGYWHRPEGPAGQALSALSRYAGLGWRHAADGAVWIGEETWPAASVVGVESVSTDGAADVATIAPDAPTVLPGQTWAGRRVERVAYTLDEHGDEGLRAVLTFVRAGDPATSRAAWERAVRAAISELHYLPRFGARVIAQTADGRLELEPDAGQGQAGTGAVPVLYGLPGVRCEVPAGSRVGLAYEAGRADQPRAMGWEAETPSTLTEIEAGTLLLGAGAELGVVRSTDKGIGGTFAPTIAGLGYVGPGGVAWQITATASGNPVVFVVAPLSDPADAGKVTTEAVECSSTVRAKS